MICLWAVEFHLPHCVMQQFGLFQTHPPKWKHTGYTLHELDRKKVKRDQKWDVTHKEHVEKYLRCVEKAKTAQGSKVRLHCPLAFSNYLKWFLDNTCADITPAAYSRDILDQPLIFDEVANLEYTRLLRQGRQTYFAPVLNFVRDEVRKEADDFESILESTTRGQEGENTALREFVK